MTKRRSFPLILAVIALTIATLACGGGGTNPLPTTAPRQATPVPATQAVVNTPKAQPPAAQPTRQPAQQGGQPSAGNSTTVRMINRSGETICYVYLSGTWESEWGSDWLGSDVVDNGDEYTFNVNAGNWDLMAQNCAGDVLEEAYDVGVPVTGLRWTVDTPSAGSGGSGGSLTINNDTANSICYVYMGPPNSEYSGDLLGSDTISSFSTYTLRNLNPGNYCVQVEDCEGYILYEECGVSIYAGASIDLWEGGDVSGDGDGSDWYINNMTGYDVCYLYISSSNSDSWGDDFLGSEILYAGDTYWVVNYSPGYYDIRMEDCNGNTIWEVFEYWIDGGEDITAW